MTILYSALYHSNDPFGCFDSVEAIVHPSELTKDGVLLLHGGADISPAIYKQKAGKYTFASNRLSIRDKDEIALVKRAIELDIPIIGICRGAQLLCAMAGGTLVQDVTNHEHGTHLIRTFDGEVLLANSLHHQMMHPQDVPHDLIAWSNKNRSTHYLGENDEEIVVEREPEIINFPSIKGFAIQGHPEYLTPNHPFVSYCTKTFKDLYVL